MNSLTVRRGLRRMRSYLIYGFALVVLTALGLGLFMPAPQWRSVGMSLVVAVLMFGLSWFTTSSMATSADPSVAWVALDYVGKAALTIGALLLAKNSAGFDVIVVATVVVASILVTAGVQVAAFVPRSRPGLVQSETDDNG